MRWVWYALGALALMAIYTSHKITPVGTGMDIYDEIASGPAD